MSDDPFQDPGFLEYAQHVIDELIPKIQQSAISISLVPSGKADVKYAVELGFCIMLDKPIIAVVGKGTKVPAKMIAVADEIVEGDMGDPDFQERLHAAIDRQMKKIR